MDEPATLANACPTCGQSDQTYKVSLLYLQASARLNRQDAGRTTELESMLRAAYPAGIQAGEMPGLLRRLVKAFAPPSGAQRITRRIHPDWLLLFAGAVGLVAAYRSAAGQSGDLPVIVTLLSASLLVYLLVRRPVLERFQGRQFQDQQQRDSIERRVGRWMRLFYCSRDQVVFDPQDSQVVPLAQMELLLDRSTDLP